MAESGETDDLFIPWVELTQNWPRSSIRSHQWLRAKWRRLRSTIKDHEKLDLKEICQALLMEFTRSNKVQMIEIPLSCSKNHFFKVITLILIELFMFGNRCDAYSFVYVHGGRAEHKLRHGYGSRS